MVVAVFVADYIIEQRRRGRWKGIADDDRGDLGPGCPVAWEGPGKPGPSLIVRGGLAYMQTHQVAHHHKKHVLMQ